MSEYTRTAVMRVLLVLGIVTPFLIGAFAEQLTQMIRRTGSVPITSTGNSIDGNATRDTLYLSAAGSDERAALTFESGKSTIAFPLDYEHSLARAKLSHRPVLLYFTAQNDIQPRKFEVTVLRSPAVVERLRKFECAAVFMDIVPHSNAAEAMRLYSQNSELRDELVEWGWVRGPVLAVVRSELNGSRGNREQQLIAKAYSWELNNDEATVNRFLDEALEKWTKSPTSGK